MAKCPKDKLWNDKQKTCTDPLESTCATLKVIHRTVTGESVPTHVSSDRRVLYRLVGDKLGATGPSLTGQGYHLIKRVRLVPSEQIEQHFKREGVPTELIEYYDKMKAVVPNYFLEVYEILNANQKHQVLSVVELVDLYKKRSLTPFQLINFYVMSGQIPRELITYYQKHPVHFESERERVQLTRIKEQEILEDLNNRKLILEQLIECYLKQGQLPEKVILSIYRQNTNQGTDTTKTVVTMEPDQLIELYKKKELNPLKLIEYYVSSGQIPQQLIIYYQKHPVHFEKEQLKKQLTRLNIEEILEDLNNGNLITEQLIELYLKRGQIPEQIITWLKKNKNEVREPTSLMPDSQVKSIKPDQLIQWYKENTLQPVQLIEYYLATKKIPEELIVLYQQNPPQLGREQRKQLKRLSIDEILEDLKNNRLLSVQLIELYIKTGQIPEQIIAWFQNKPDVNVDEGNKAIDLDQVIVEAYKTNKLDVTQLIQYYKNSKKLPEQLIVFYQEHPPKLESEEQKYQLTRVTIEQILEDMQSNRLLPAQLIEFYIKNGQIPDQIISLFEKINTKTDEDRMMNTEGTDDKVKRPDVNMPSFEPDQLINLYKTNKLSPDQLIECYITTGKIPREFIVYYKKHQSQFESEEQKAQMTRLTVEEILEDLKNKRLIIPQLIEFYIKQGQIDSQIVGWYQMHKQSGIPEDRVVVPTEQDPTNPMIELYKTNQLQPSHLIEYFITKQTLPPELIDFYQKHPPNFETEEQKAQQTRISIEEILTDLNRGKLLPTQLIEFFIKQGKLDDRIIAWFKENDKKSVLKERSDIDPDQLVTIYEKHELKPELLIEYYISKHEIPQQLIVYYQKHPPRFDDQQLKTQLTRITIEEILDDLKNNRLLPEQLIEFYLKQRQIPEQVILWYQKHSTKEVVPEEMDNNKDVVHKEVDTTKEVVPEEVPSTKEVVPEETKQTVTIDKEHLIENYKKHALEPTHLIQYYITKKEIPEELIIYYQEHPPKFETEEQKTQLTRLSVEEILDDLKGGRLLPSQLIEFYMKNGQLPQQIIVWFQKHVLVDQPTTEDRTVVTRPEVLVEQYKEHKLKPTLLIEYYLITHTIPEQLIVYYKKHPPQFTKEEERRQLTRLSEEEILEDLKNNRLIPSQLIEFYLKKGLIPEQLIVWFQQHRKPTLVTEVIEQTKPLSINKELLIDNYKRNSLNPFQLIEYFIVKHEIPQELIIYYKTHPPKFETEEQKLQIKRISVIEILQDLLSGRLLPYQLIEFYLKHGQIPQQVIVWFQKHRSVPNKETTTEVKEPEQRPGVQIDIKDLMHYYKTDQLKPEHLLEWYLRKNELPQELLIYYQKYPPKTQLPTLDVHQIYEQLKSNKLKPVFLIQLYLKYGRLPRAFVQWFKKQKKKHTPMPVNYEELKPDPTQSSVGTECKAYINESDEGLNLDILCGSCRSSTYAVPHPKSYKKYVVCNVKTKESIKHLIRKCSHGLVFDKTFMTCEKKNVVEECSSA